MRSVREWESRSRISISSTCRLVTNFGCNVVFIEYVGDTRAGNSWIHCHRRGKNTRKKKNHRRGRGELQGMSRVTRPSWRFSRPFNRGSRLQDVTPKILSLPCLSCVYLFGISGSPAPNAWAVANNKLSYDFFFYFYFFLFAFSSKSLLYFPSRKKKHFFKINPRHIRG